MNFVLNQLEEEEYKNFYRETFMDFNEPLFWIHLNMEYPFRLKGILYFPQVKKQQVQLEKGQVKLYCNPVFIADNNVILSRLDINIVKRNSA